MNGHSGRFRAVCEPGAALAVLALPMLALAVLALAALVVPLRPEAALIFPPFTEDGYYSLTIARAIAAGRGPSIEGSGLTNGFQPLVTAIQAGAFALAGGESMPALRLVAAFGWLTYALTAVLVGLIAADAAPAAEPGCRLRRFLVAAFLYAASLKLWLDHFNGLETGLLLMLYALLWRLWQRGVPERGRGLVLAGILLGLLVLTRIDAALFVAVLAGVELVAAWRRGPARALARAATLGVLALAVSAPWWAYNLLVFGSPMPTSGSAQLLWAADLYRWRWMAWSIGLDLAPWLGQGSGFDTWSGWVPLAGATAVLAGVWPRLRTASALAGGSARFATALAATLLLFLLWYGFSFFAFWFYSRYLVPAALLGVVAAALACEGLPRAWRRLAPIAVLLLMFPVLSGALAAWRGSLTHFGTIMFWDQVELVRAVVPEGEWVAAGQSGTLGFFRPHVLNMDGKVNPEARAVAGHATPYLAGRGIRWFADWEWYLHRALGPDPEALGWVKVAERGNFLLYRYEGPPAP
jgi:hypothetical protein